MADDKGGQVEGGKASRASNDELLSENEEGKKMNLTYGFQAFTWIIIINTLITIIYILVNLFRKKKNRTSFLVKSIVMFLCPIAGPVYILLSRVIMWVFFRKPVDLEDVIFSKERESILVSAEEEKERNLVSIEDALLISGKEDSRALLLDVIKRAPRKTLSSISLALDSPDSELAHYAASIIQSEMAKVHRFIQEARKRILALEEEILKLENDLDEKYRAEASEAEAPGNEKGRTRYRTEAGTRFFIQWLDRLRLSDGEGASNLVYDNGADGEEMLDIRDFELYYADISEKLEESKDYSKHKDLASRQGLLARYGKTEDTKSIIEKLTDEMAAAHELISELENILKQKVLTEFDSNRYLDILQEISLLVEKRDVLSEEEIGLLVAMMLDAGRIEAAARWTEKAAFWYPDSLVCYSTRVRLRFAQNDREGFFKALEEMKRSDLQLDNDMLELVRFFV